MLPRNKQFVTQLCLAGVLGSLIMDGDSWLYLIGPHYYGKFHRVASHSIVGLAVCAVVAASLAWLVTMRRPWRRFGWFVSNNMPRSEPPPAHPPWRLFLAVAAIAAALHFAGDAVTGFGNVTPYWPWSWRDVSLHAVNSFDPALFSLTLAWHISFRWKGPSERRKWLATAIYAALAVCYILIRLWFFDETVW